MTDEEQKSLPRVRTFETDIEIRKKSGISPSEVVAKSRILAQEEIKRLNARRIAIIAIIILIGGGTVFGLFRYFKDENESPEETPKSTQVGKPYIKAELEKKILFSSIDPGSLISAIKKEVETQRKSDSLLFLMLPQTIREFTQFTKIKIPEPLLQNSHPSFNIFTAYHTGSSSVVFFIKTENFEKAYSAMLSWEKDMWQSFSQFLDKEDIKNINRFSFVDEILKNHDSRILKNQERRGILAYAIFNKQFVVITTSKEALSIVLQRLIASPPK